MGSGILGIGTSGLLAFQRGLAVTGHNIANSATEGYSRQRVELNTRPPQFAGNGYVGTGVQVGSVKRVFDQFIENQLRTATSSSAQSSLFYDYAKRVDSLLASPDSGLAPGLQRFFAAVQDVATDPTSIPARQVMIAEGASLSDRFRFLDQQLENQRTLVNGQIETTVEDINRLAQDLADLNQVIMGARGRAGGAPPNDLLDQRDRLVRELAELVNVTAVPQDDDVLNVFIGNGQSLVVGSTAFELEAAPLGEDPMQVGIGYATPGGTVADISRFMTGGKLGALLDLRTSVLDTAQNALGLTAVGLAHSFNDHHRRGQDLDGVIGRDFFRTPEPQVLAAQPGSAPTVTIADAGALGAGDFRLVAVDDGDGGVDWQLRRVPGGQVVPDWSSVGLEIDPTGIAAKAGDSFLIRPTRTAARGIDTVIEDPMAVAAARPDTGNSTLRSVRFVPDEPGGHAQVLRIDELAESTFRWVDDRIIVDSPPDLSVDGKIIDGNLVITLANEQGTWFLEFDGIPESVSFERAGPGDNSNALALGALQDERFLARGTATLEGTYNTMIGEVGTRTRQAEIASQSQARLLDEARNMRDSISGVNLDEEAANLLRYQQAYQAAAQVIAVSSTLFDTLLMAVRR